MNFSAIITCGGSGKRFASDQKKQFVDLLGKPVIIHSIEKFYQNHLFKEIIITLPKEDIGFGTKLIETNYKTSSKIKIIKGGNTRQKSVYKALKTCRVSSDFVAIHDGVRPLVSKNLIEKLCKEVMKTNAVIPVSALNYTIKKIEKDSVLKTPDRNQYVNVHTPQMFRLELIKKYHEKAQDVNYSFTDDASILEYFGITVKILRCSGDNIKITHPIDLKIAELLLKL